MAVAVPVLDEASRMILLNKVVADRFLQIGTSYRAVIVPVVHDVSLGTIGGVSCCCCEWNMK